MSKIRMSGDGLGREVFCEPQVSLAKVPTEERKLKGPVLGKSDFFFLLDIMS